ncbi:MAG: 50S ribosomal protein L23 [Parachlamydiales bacterium]|jgi:large subunit ribosomal protein L23
MNKKTPYDIVKKRYITEKSTMLSSLKDKESNPSLRRFTLPKYVFLVDTKANKIEIARAVEEIYAHLNVKVVAVNTINVKGKARRVRGRLGTTSSYKKAIVTLEKDDVLESV